MLIAIDAGHGHNTPGKRCPDDSMREHDFNGAVATIICDNLKKYKIETYRSDDYTGSIDVPLQTRTNNINSRNAVLCVSIHANAYTGKWNSANGIETYIYAKGGEAEKLAKIVHSKLIQATGRRDRGVKVGNLHMCRETKMPAILCECGFMDNVDEAFLLKSNEYRVKCANAITEGIIEYLDIKEVKEEPKEEIKQEPQSVFTVKITTDTLNVRAGAGTNYKINTTVKKGEIYTIIEEKGNWGKLKSGAGWISLSYTSRNVEFKDPEPTPSKYVLGLYSVTASALNVRQGAGTSYPVVKAYKKGTRFDTYELKGSWAKTPIGWVCLDYCKLVKKY